MIRKLGLSRYILAIISIIILALVMCGTLFIRSSSSMIEQTLERGDSAVSQFKKNTITIANIAATHGMVSTLIRQQDIDVIEKTNQQIDSTIQNILETLQSCGSNCISVLDLMNKYQSIERSVIDAFLKGQQALAIERYMNELSPIYDSIIRSTIDVVNQTHQRLSAESDLGRQRTHWQKRTLITVTFLFILLVAGGGFYFRTTLVRELELISNALAKSGIDLRIASEQLSKSNKQIADGTSQTATALTQTLASLEELSSMVSLNAEHAKEASKASQHSRTSAEEGSAQIGALITSMNEISDSAKKIEEITSVIDDMSFQTNLLALNAAVEAARAGEHGKGFAVVADAVRNLAQRSASAARQIDQLIKDSVHKTQRGAELAEQSNTALHQIVTSIRKAAELNNEIASASSQQTLGINQINQAMVNVDQSTQSAVVYTKETDGSARGLHEQAITLQNLVNYLAQLLHGADHAPSNERQNHGAETLKLHS